MKTVYRIYDKDNMAAADLICLKDEVLTPQAPHIPSRGDMEKTFYRVLMRNLMVDIIRTASWFIKCLL